MFLISLKSLKGKFLLLAATVVAAVVVFTVISSSENKSASAGEGFLNYSASTDEQRLNFIESLGLTVRNEPDSVKEFVLPDEFDEVYEEYNKIQKQTGLDLSAYKGNTVKKWTYTVTNYPDYENSDVIKLTLIVCNGRIIGGDICSTELDGFMLPLTKQESLWQKKDLTN